MTNSEPTIAEAQAALDRVRQTLAVKFERVKSVAPFPGKPGYYDVHFWHGPAITVLWQPGRESFEASMRATLVRYLLGDGHELLADHPGH